MAPAQGVQQAWHQLAPGVAPRSGRPATVGGGELMTGPSRSPVTRGRTAGLTGRRSERNALDRLADAVRGGQSRALVMRGEPGVGKTVLLDYLATRARGCRVARTAGVQTEMELAFAGLHQLCGPMLGRAEHLPVPQRDALRTAFGLAAGPPPDRFLVGLAGLSLLSEVAAERPLICLVDDQQWLDRASAQALGFAARRLGADPVGLVFAAREPGAELAGLPELEVGGLRESDARTLLDSALAGPLDDRVRDQIVAETQGNPLALLELPRGLSPAELAGGFGLPGAQPSMTPLSERIAESFRRQLAALPEPSRRLLLVAAAEPYGDLPLILRAAGQLGIPVQAAAPAVDAGLVEFAARVRFRHPLLRSVSYRTASVADRQAVHGALAETTDPQTAPERQAWHRAQAAAGPDEEVAAELERSAGRAQARGGLAAAAAFLARAATLTPDPGRRAGRLLAAARAKRDAGAPGAALRLLAEAEAEPVDDLQAAELERLRGQIAFDQQHGTDAARLLLSAAQTAMGELAVAARLMEEDHLIAEATGNPPIALAEMMIATWRGREDEALPLIEAVSDASAASGLGLMVDFCGYARSVLYNGLGRHDAARDTARRAFELHPIGYGPLVVSELAEAAARTGDTGLGQAALESASGRARVTPTPWALGIEARARALLSSGEAADKCYRESIGYLGRTRMRSEVARGHLLYGEWLRRENRRVDAREQLRTACGMLDAMGMEAFAERARRELLATGESVRKPVSGTKI